MDKIDVNKLSRLELAEYQAAQDCYKRRTGYSNDRLRFERYFYHIRRLGRFDISSAVLDAGCGPGPLERYLLYYGFVNVDAMDFSAEGIKWCEETIPEFSYKVGNITDVGDMYKGREFDLVFCCQVLEHVPEHKNVIKQLYSLVKVGGLFIISVPWDRCKDCERHINHYLPSTFVDIAKEFDMSLPVVTERFGEYDLQLLVIFIK